MIYIFARSGTTTEGMRKPVLNITTSSSYSASPTKMPCSQMRPTPCPLVSTGVTLGRLRLWRYSSWKQGRLHLVGYQGLQLFSRIWILDDFLDAFTDHFLMWKFHGVQGRNMGRYRVGRDFSRASSYSTILRYLGPPIVD